MVVAVAVGVAVAVAVAVVVMCAAKFTVAVAVAMILGFTGTCKGCTPAQLAALRTFLGLYQPGTLLHGGAVGADCEVHQIGVINKWGVEIYPADLYGTPHWWVPTNWYLSSKGHVHPPQPPFIRNGIIARRVRFEDGPGVNGECLCRSP